MSLAWHKSDRLKTTPDRKRMQLRFMNTFQFTQPLELILASTRYATFWEEHETEIITSLYRHTGLHFQQRSITVVIWDEAGSRAGNTNQPMKLSAQVHDEARVGATLIHELSHRLIIGNGIEPSSLPNARPRASYHMHRHIDLFLYDVLVDVLGKSTADDEVATEKSYSNMCYRLAWEWALKMNYTERQNALANLKQRYYATTSNHNRRSNKRKLEQKY
jgi:hypothetical protein